MKSMMRKTTLREIKQSFGRFIAILAIIALGVGLYAGLTITQDSMVQTMDEYLKEQDFFDYRLLSTLGFEKTDIEAFEAAEEVDAAEGAYSLDVLYRNAEGNESVIKLHSLTDRVNRVRINAGRLPENETECVVDGNLFSKDAIGSKLVLSENNETEVFDNLTEREFTIVGIVQSPYYVNFERGTTSLGNGQLEGFAYLHKDAFEMEYFTEAFVKFAQDGVIYSEEYNSFMEEKEPIWEALCQERADLRFASILEDANAELAEAEAELTKQKSEAETELADALADLQEAEEKLADGEEQIADAKDSLKEQEDALAASLTQYLPEYDPTGAIKAQLDQGQMQIDAAKKELRDKEAELVDARLELEDGWKEYEEGRAEFEEEIAEAEEKLADAKEEITSLEEPDTYVLGRETNIGYACFENDSSIVAGIAKVFPVFFFLVAALVCITTMNRMVEEQRTQIGVLKALGYGNHTIMAKYLFYSGSGAVAGCLMGFFAGTYVFPRIIWTAYGIMYTVVPLKYIFDGWMLLISMLVSLLCSIGATWFSCKYELAEVAAQLMRPKAPKAGKRVFLEKLPFLWKRLKFLHKVSIRNIFRYKKRFFMMVVGISGCTALLVTGFGIRDSIFNIAAYQYEEIMIFDGTVNFTEARSKEEEAFVKDGEKLVEDYLYIAQQSADIYVGDKVKAVSLVVAKDQERLPEFIDFHNADKEKIGQPAKNQAVINTKLADTFKLKTGDEILLRNEDMKEIRVTISGIFENFIDNYVFVDEATYTEQIGAQPEYKGAYVKFAKGSDVHACSAAIMDMEDVTAVSVNADMKERIGSMMSSLNYIVITIIVCAACLAFIVLYNLTNINITERIREIATIKVLGFYKKETAQYVFRENMLLTSIGSLVGLVLGKLLHAFVMGEINIDMIAFDVRVRPISYWYSVLLTLLFAWFVNLFMTVKLEKINMAESLKSVD